MRSLVAALGVCLFLVGAMPTAGAAEQGRGRKPKHDRAAASHKPERDSRAAVHVVFASGDVAILRRHYAPRYRNLPPGLQKKIARGGTLPPGWQKKLEAFPPALERRLQPLPRDYRRGVLDGHAVIYNSRTSVIVDAAVLF